MNTLLVCLSTFHLILPGCEVGGTLELPDPEHGIQVQGMDRVYRIFKPTSIEATKPVPLLFVFHGGGGDAELAQEYFGFDALAGEHAFMVVYPEAVNGHWNDGRKGERFAKQNATIDDVIYFREVLKDVRSRHQVDDSRIFAMGASNGGMFVQRLALEETATFAAVASTISSLPEPLKANFKPALPLSVLFMSGTEDPIMPFDGGEIVLRLFPGNKKRRWEKSRGRVLPVREAAEMWATHNKIDGAGESTQLPDVVTGDQSRVRLRKWASEDPDGATVLLYEIIGGGHTMPQLKSVAPKRMVGRTNEDINTQEVIWKFFSNKRRKLAQETPIEGK